MFDAIGIVSSNINESIKFYSIFGLNFKELGVGHFEATTKNGTRVMLDSIELMQKINPQYKMSVGNNIIICFKQSLAVEVDSLFSKSVEAGYASLTVPWDTFWGQRYASIKDPDGNQIDIFADIQMT